MNAVVMQRYGGPEVLEYGQFPDPMPGAGEVLIKVAAASINPVDLMQRTGATQSYFPLEFPNVIGWDVSGTIAELGPGVAGFSVGDRVFAWALPFKAIGALWPVLKSDPVLASAAQHDWREMKKPHRPYREW